MASGFLAPLAVLLVLAAAVVLERKTWRMHLPGFVLCLLCVAVSVPLMVKVSKHADLHAAGLHDFLLSFIKNLSWPAYHTPVAFLVFLFPMFFMAPPPAPHPTPRPRPPGVLL